MPRQKTNMTPARAGPPPRQLRQRPPQQIRLPSPSSPFLRRPGKRVPQSLQHEPPQADTTAH